VAQRAVARPLAEADLGDELRLDPRRAARGRVAGAEGRVLACELGHLRAKRLQLALVEAGADLARVAQGLVLVVADEQRAELLAAALRRGEAADDELLLGRAFPLQPVAAALAHVAAVRTLGDEALPAAAARLGEVLLAVLGLAVRGPAHGGLAEAQRAAQQPLAPRQ